MLTADHFLCFQFLSFALPTRCEGNIFSPSDFSLDFSKIYLLSISFKFLEDYQFIF